MAVEHSMNIEAAVSIQGVRGPKMVRGSAAGNVNPIFTCHSGDVLGNDADEAQSRARVSGLRVAQDISDHIRYLIGREDQVWHIWM